MASPVGRFFWRILLWLPLCFAGWYYMAGVISLPVSLLVDSLMTWLFPTAIGEIDPHGHMLDVVTLFTPPAQAGVVIPVGQIAQLVFSINALIYGFSIPLYTALVLSSPGNERQKWTRWALGFLILLLAQAWGISFDILKTLLFQMGPEMRQQMAFTRLEREMVALGYQFGSLVLPAVTPLVVWIGFHRAFLFTLAPAIAGRFSGKRES